MKSFERPFNFVLKSKKQAPKNPPLVVEFSV